MKPIGRGLNVSVSYSIKHPDEVMMFIVFEYYRGEKTMKLNLLFIGMDLLTLLAYPIVFVLNKLRQFSK